MSNFEEKTLASKKIYQGKVIDLQVDEVELPNGKKSIREIVKHPGAVCVFAVTEEDTLLMVRQFRKPLERTTLEIPAGKLEEGEDPGQGAMRELEEETGYRAEVMEPLLVPFFTSPGFASECLHLFRARGLTVGKAKLDEDELVEVEALTIEECWKRIKTSEICDAKTLLAVYIWQNERLCKR